MRRALAIFALVAVLFFIPAAAQFGGDNTTQAVNNRFSVELPDKDYVSQITEINSLKTMNDIFFKLVALALVLVLFAYLFQRSTKEQISDESNQIKTFLNKQVDPALNALIRNQDQDNLADFIKDMKESLGRIEKAMQNGAGAQKA